jgi:transcriptional regulator with XRE-family HTH domain
VSAAFRDKLRALLAGRGMSQNELARRSHYNAAYLSKVINGRKPVPRELAVRLDELLGADGELAALAPVRVAVTVPYGPGSCPAPIRQQLAVMSGQIEVLRTDVSALTEVVTFALLGVSPAAVAGGKTRRPADAGGVKYTSRREAQTKAALAQAKLAKEERRAVRHERKAEGTEHREAEAEQREQAAEGLPWYRQPTLGAAIAAARKNKGNDHADGHHEA